MQEGIIISIATVTEVYSETGEITVNAYKNPANDFRNIYEVEGEIPIIYHIYD